MFRLAHRKAIALLVLPAILTFGVQSALELFHPIEEAVPELASHEHVEVGDGGSLHDSGQTGLGDHEHHYCAHSNALAHLARLEAASWHGGAFAPAFFDAEAAIVRSTFSVLDRGPPLL